MFLVHYVTQVWQPFVFSCKIGGFEKARLICLQTLSQETAFQNCILKAIDGITCVVFCIDAYRIL